MGFKDLVLLPYFDDRAVDPTSGEHVERWRCRDKNTVPKPAHKVKNLEISKCR